MTRTVNHRSEVLEGCLVVRCCLAAEDEGYEDSIDKRVSQVGVEIQSFLKQHLTNTCAQRPPEVEEYYVRSEPRHNEKNSLLFDPTHEEDNRAIS